MSIRINLLAEAQIAEDLRRRDPVKRAVFVGAFLLVLSLAWSSSIQLGVMMSKRDLARLQTTIDGRTNAWQTVLSSQQKIYETRAKLGSLQNLAGSRFLQGNFMNALQLLNLSGVQLMRVKLDQSFEKSEAAPNKTKDAHAAGGHPVVITEKIHVSLDARDSSANPGDQINKFKDMIASQAYFESRLVASNGVHLVSLSPVQSGLEEKPFVLFTVAWDLSPQPLQNP